MINKKNGFPEMQISIFDLDFIHPKEVKQEKKTIINVQDNKFTEIINLYRPSAVRIVKQVCGALLVEMEDKTLYFNSSGIKELELKKDMELMPADEILVVNEDRQINELQLEKLNNMNVSQYIKRKGDANIIIQKTNRTIIINPKGWIIEYLQKSIYHENEIFSTEMAEEITELDSKITNVDINITKSINDDISMNFKINDSVQIEYDGIKHNGKVVSIYNNGETINVTWKGKHTAFYYKNVKKVS